MSSSSPDEGRAPRRTVGLSNRSLGHAGGCGAAGLFCTVGGGGREGRGVGENVGELCRDIGEDPQPVGAAVERHSGHGLRVERLKRWSSRPAFSRFDFDEVFAIPSEYDP